MPHRKNRIYRRALTQGCSALTSTELLTLIFGGDPRIEPYAEAVLKKVEYNLPALARLSYGDLCRFEGIGTSRALSLESAWELGRRRQEESFSVNPAIRSSRDAFELIKTHLQDLTHEEFWVLLLNRSHRLILKKQVSRGGISGTIVDTRLIYKWAVDHLASAIIVAHNHPSGQLKPSKSDIQLTQRLRKAGHLLEIPLLDHLILSAGGYISFSDQQLMPLE